MCGGCERWGECAGGCEGWRESAGGCERWRESVLVGVRGGRVCWWV